MSGELDAAWAEAEAALPEGHVLAELRRSIGVYARIEQRLDRIEDKLDTRMTSLDDKVDKLGSRQDRLEGKLDGSVGMVKWLGPTGIAALLFGILKAAGLL